MAKTPFMVTLYFRGQNLRPDLITKRLGISPTETRRKGEKRLGGQGRSYINTIGIWALQTTTTSKKLSTHLGELTSKVKSLEKIDKTVGVEEAYIDVFLCFKRTEDSDSYEFSISKKNIKEINSLGIPVQFTVSSFEGGK